MILILIFFVKNMEVLILSKLGKRGANRIKMKILSQWRTLCHQDSWTKVLASETSHTESISKAYKKWWQIRELVPYLVEEGAIWQMGRMSNIRERDISKSRGRRDRWIEKSRFWRLIIWMKIISCKLTKSTLNHQQPLTNLKREYKTFKTWSKRKKKKAATNLIP